MVMTKMFKLLVLPVFLTVLILTGCTNKNNPTGTNWSDVQPLSFADSTSFFGGYSYAGEKKISGAESNLLCGNYNGVEAVSVLRYIGLPKPGKFEIASGHQDSTFLVLTLVKRSPLRRNPVDLQVYKLNQAWAADSTELVSDANLTQITTAAFTIPDTISTAGTAVKIPIPYEEIESWRSVADTTGFNLVIKSGANSFVEMRSAETGRGPTLKFTYTAEGDTTNSTYEASAVRDSYRIVADPAPLQPNRWLIGNLSPSRIYVNFGLNYNLFVDQHGVPLSEAQRKRATVNKAELVLHVKDNPYYGALAQYSLRADRLNSAPDSIPVVIADGEASSGLTSQALISDGKVYINITPIIQAYSSGDLESEGDQPWGIVIKSNQEMLNFGSLEFWHHADAPAGKAPQLKITYTPPFL